MRLEAGRNMVSGIQNNRRKGDIIGNKLPDPFMDSYQEETLECCAIIDMIDSCKSECLDFTIDKVFLKKIIRSHVMFIREVEKGLRCPQK